MVTGHFHSQPNPSHGSHGSKIIIYIFLLFEKVGNFLNKRDSGLALTMKSSPGRGRAGESRGCEGKGWFLFAGFWCLSAREWRADKRGRAERKFPKEALLAGAESLCGSNEAIYLVFADVLLHHLHRHHHQVLCRAASLMLCSRVKQLACPTALPLRAERSPLISCRPETSSAAKAIPN